MMRITTIYLGVGLMACGGSDKSSSVDAQTGNDPPPRVIAGGGIGDGAVDGVVNLYVIDDATRLPVSGAAVTIGTLDGTTDATGLFVATGLTGAQTVVVKASGYRSEMWVGANGANMTVDVQLATPATPPSATIAGTITGIPGITVADGHAKLAVVTYSQTDNLGDAANSIMTANNTNACVVLATTPCTYTLTSRVGNVSLIGLVFDRDLKGTPDDPSDDTQVLIGYASLTNLTVVAGATMTGQDLALIPSAMVTTETVDFGTPPSGLTTIEGIIGIDLPGGDVFQLPTPILSGSLTNMVPSLAALNASGYRLTSVAANSTATNAAQSITLHRDLTASTLSAGTWLPLPTDVNVDHATASWTAVPGATVNGLEYDSGATALLNITTFDGSSSVTIPDLELLPSGTLTAKVSAIGAPGLDVTNFSLDADKAKLSEVASLPTQVGN